MKRFHKTIAILTAGALCVFPLHGAAQKAKTSVKKEADTMTSAERKGFNAVKKYLAEIGKIESAGVVKEEGREVLVIRFRLSPTPQSCIRIGISMPKHALWTGKLIGLGNCGFPTGYADDFYNWKAFVPDTGCTQQLIQNNNVVVTSDMGISRHRENNPEVWKDFGFRSTHLMTVTAKEIIRLYYGKPAARSYFLGLSTGGGQGLHEAQKFPEDYDGIISVVPACSRIQGWASGLCFYLRTHKPDGTPLFTRKQLSIIGNAAVTYFKGKGPAYASGKFVADPRYNKKAAEEIARIAAEKDPSLAGELQKKIPAVFEDSVIGGKMAACGQPLGGADLWKIVEPEFLPYKWYHGRDFDIRKYDYNKEFPKMAAAMGPIFNADNPDLSAFRKRGGKLIIYAGTEDCLVPCSGPAMYYERAAKAAGGYDKLKEFCLYYQLPGRSHVSGRGIRTLENLEQVLFDWCEKGIAPDVLNGVSAKGKKYPVYPYPMMTTGDEKSGYKAVPVPGLPSVQPDPVYRAFITEEQAKQEYASKGQEIRYPEGKVSNWYGFKRHDFEIDGHKAFIVEPKKAAPGRPWTWCLQWPEAFVSKTPALLLLKAGYHHVHIDVYSTRMNDEGIRIAKKFYDLLQSLYLNPKGALIGMSSGGLFSFRWAAEYPETVSCIYADAPLTAFVNKGEKNVTKEHRRLWNLNAKGYGVSGYRELLNHPKAPNNNCGVIAKAKIPVYLIRHGQDQTLPCETQCDIFIKNFRKAGGEIIVKDMDMYGHHPHGLDNPKEIADFILKYEY